MRGGAELSAMAEMRPGARKHEGEERGSARKLTAIMLKRSAARGEVRCGRNGEADLWRPEEEDDGEDGATGLPASRRLVETKRKARRFFWKHRRGEGWTRAAATASHGDGAVRGVRERDPGEEGEREGVREAEASVWPRWGPPTASGEAGGGRRVLARGKHALGVLLARWRRRLAAPVSWAGLLATGLPGCR